MGLFDMFNTGGINYGNSAIPENASPEYRAMMGQLNNTPSGMSLEGNNGTSAAQVQAQSRPQPQAAPANQGPSGNSTWNFSNGGLTQDPNIKAPTYNDPTTTFLGQRYLTPGASIDPALATTFMAGNQGAGATGLGAFLRSSSNNDFNALGAYGQGGAQYSDSDMLGIAKGLGIDTQGKTGRALQDYLDPQLQDYTLIGGLSGGWNPSSDARQANGTIYKSVGGKLVPYQTQSYHAPEVGSWLSENKGILAPLGVVGAGLALGAAGGAAGSAGSAGAAGSSTGAAAGSAGAAGSASSGWLGSLANYAGLGGQFSALPGYAQAGLQGAIQGGVTSGLTGGNPLMGALTGGLTGGLTPGVNSALSGLGGLPSYATNALGASGLGALTQGISGGNPLMGALGAGVSSGIGGGLQANGVNSGLASILGRAGGSAATGLAQGRDLSSIFSPQQLAMLVANPRTLQALFNRG